MTTMTAQAIRRPRFFYITNIMPGTEPGMGNVRHRHERAELADVARMARSMLSIQGKGRSDPSAKVAVEKVEWANLKVGETTQVDADYPNNCANYGVGDGKPSTVTVYVTRVY